MSDAAANAARTSVDLSDSWATRVETAMYGAMAIGYLYAVLAPQRPRWPGFLLLTACCGAWVALYRYINRRHRPRRFWAAFAGLVACAIFTQVAALWGVQLDWLAPVLTVGFVAAVLPLVWAFVLSAGIAATTLVVIMLLTVRPGQNGFLALWNSINVIPAFAFAFLFSLALTMLERQRDHARQLLAQLEEAHQQVRAHAKEAEELAVAQERNRMAREIHDTLGHYLTILAVELETALKLEERNDERLRAQLSQARRMATDCLTEVRHSVAALRPADPSAQSLDAALARLRSEYAAALPETEITLDIEGPIRMLAPELRVALYRCAQEALTNIRKHAQASKALVRVRVGEGEVEMTVLDNGLGAQSDGPEREPGFGLLGMRERVALLNGVAVAQPELDHGWRVEVRVPLRTDTLARVAIDEPQTVAVGGVS